MISVPNRFGTAPGEKPLMSLTKYGIFLAAILLAIWSLHRKAISTFHIAVIVLTYLVVTALIFLALLVIVDRNLATTKDLLRSSQKSLSSTISRR
jgi:amino acid permease